VPSAPRALPARIDAASGAPPSPPPTAGAATEGVTGAQGAAAATPEAKVALASKPTTAPAPDATAVAQGSGAESRPKVTIEGPDTAKAGDEIAVSVKLSSPSALGRIRTQVAFDATALQLVSAEPGDLAPSGEKPKVDMKPGGVQLELAGGEGAPVSGSGSLIDLRFRMVGARPETSIATQVVLIGEDGVAVAATQATPLRITVAK
jgi:hypothetical protein